MFTFTRTRAKNIQTHHFHAFLFFSAYKPFLQENKKKIRLVRFELSSVLHLNRYTTADDTVPSLLTSDNLISSYIRRKLAKTTDNRSEIKLAYATPFELQGQKNTTIQKDLSLLAVIVAYFIKYHSKSACVSKNCIFLNGIIWFSTRIRLTKFNFRQACDARAQVSKTVDIVADWMLRFEYSSAICFFLKSTFKKSGV